MCIICDYSKKIEGIGREIGAALAETTTDSELTAAAADKAAAHIHGIIIQTVMLADFKHNMATTERKATMVKVYGEEIVSEMQALIDAAPDMACTDMDKRLSAMLVKITENKVKQLVGALKGFMPPIPPNSEEDPNLN